MRIRVPVLGLISSFTNLLFSPYISSCLSEDWQFIILWEKNPTKVLIWSTMCSAWFHSKACSMRWGLRWAPPEPVSNQSLWAKQGLGAVPSTLPGNTTGDTSLPLVHPTLSLHCHSSRCLFHLENYRTKSARHPGKHLLSQF